jgi:hypothetical protein
MTTGFRRILVLGFLGGASLVHASVTEPRDCQSNSREPPTLEVRVLGKSDSRVTGAKVVLAARKGAWTATVYTDEAGEARFKPPTAGQYTIRVTCDVDSCGDKRQLEHNVELHYGASTSTLLPTESVVIY